MTDGADGANGADGTDGADRTDATNVTDCERAEPAGRADRQPSSSAAKPVLPAQPTMKAPWRIVQPLDPGFTTSSGRRGDQAVLEALQCITGTGDTGWQGAERLLAHSRRAGIGPSHLWSAIDTDGRVRSTALAMACPGRTAQLLCARPRDDHEEHAAGILVAAAFGDLSPDQASVAQTLLEPVAPGSSETVAPSAAARHIRVFESARFSALAVLDTLVRDRSRHGLRHGRIAPPPSGVSFEPWRPGDTTLHRVLESSYDSTLDCPGLRGLRRIDDIVAGHLASGRFDPRLWSIMRVDGVPVGAVLLSGSHAADELDLVYLGVAAVARRRGLGAAALVHALGQADDRGKRICLAVDRSNTPAMRLYERHGFRRIGSRLAMIRAVA